MEKKKIVFLYTEIAGYFLACIRHLLEHFSAEIHIVRYAVNKEAPFQFKFPDGITVYERNNYSDDQLLSLIDSISPHIIVCSGWIDKGYLNVCKHYKNKASTVLTLDNHWNGSIKQWLACFISPFYLLRRFSYCWVPGEPQHKYARQLGFKSKKIRTGFYSCDYDYFHKQYLLNKQQKQTNYPKRFIYTGRYVKQKAISELWEAFIDLQKESPNDWELWCLGTGDITPVSHPKIKHFGFVQPADMAQFIAGTGVFVLPSHFEPWGVVVHEFAASGFPVICSDQVGARTIFVENNLNGYIYASGNLNVLKSVMAKVMSLSNEQLISMASKSAEKAGLITPELWSKQLISFV